MVFIEYPHEGIAFVIGLNFFYFWGKKRFFGLHARLESFF
jgi:hypothetical protein